MHMHTAVNRQTRADVQFVSAKRLTSWTGLLAPLLQALPNETSPHFALATQGLTYAGGEAAKLLFQTTDCLCEDDRVQYCINDPNSESGTGCC
jgi:hypothetical protein